MMAKLILRKLKSPEREIWSKLEGEVVADRSACIYKCGWPTVVDATVISTPILPCLPLTMEPIKK